MKDRFTRVLKGHIALARATFPEGTTGGQLDALARQFLWAAGCDYDHGTGHGVGSHLSVHEGPQRIGKRGGDAALMPGMIVSNEPGYYKTGEYGIRIESLVVVKEVSIVGGRRYLGFETITLAPIDLRLVDKALLNKEESEWLASYHRKVQAAHMAHLSPEEATWLQRVALHA
jgi:Xaa-Pro aminopeptidase